MNVYEDKNVDLVTHWPRMSHTRQECESISLKEIVNRIIIRILNKKIIFLTIKQGRTKEPLKIQLLTLPKVTMYFHYHILLQA